MTARSYGGPRPCHRCRGKSLHYANCPLAGDEVYSMNAFVIEPEMRKEPDAILAAHAIDRDHK